MVLDDVKSDGRSQFIVQTVEQQGAQYTVSTEIGLGWYSDYDC